MKIIKPSFLLFFVVSLFLITGSCEDDDKDFCAKTRWPMKKTFEIRLAIHLADDNPVLPASTAGSQYPSEFKELLVSGTIEKIRCDSVSVKPVNLGNTYIEKGEDWPAPIDVPGSYWFGHVVYVFEFDNDKDRIDINLNIKITMENGKSYVCNYSEDIFHNRIIQMPMDMYHYILLDVFSENWTEI